MRMEPGVKCPDPGCNGGLVERKTRKGRRFYGCSRYPKCRFALWDRPVDMTCPNCSAPFVVEKLRDGEQMLRCQEKGCSFEKRAES